MQKRYGTGERGRNTPSNALYNPYGPQLIYIYISLNIWSSFEGFWGAHWEMGTTLAVCLTTQGFKQAGHKVETNKVTSFFPSCSYQFLIISHNSPPFSHHFLISFSYFSMFLFHTPNCPSRGEIPKILKLAWGKAFVEVVAMRRLACV